MKKGFNDMTDSEIEEFKYDKDAGHEFHIEELEDLDKEEHTFEKLFQEELKRINIQADKVISRFNQRRKMKKIVKKHYLKRKGVFSKWN